MKKYLAMLCATMMCVCCLGLVACGGGSSSSAASGSASASSASASASASSAAADAQFAGDWKFAALETQGITMSGDLSAMFGDNVGFALVVNADGTGKISFGDDAVDMTWVQKDPKTITVTPVASASGSSASASSASGESAAPQTIDIISKDGALLMELTSSDVSGTVIFTADGKYPGAKEISVENAKPVTSLDSLVGSWKFTGLNMMGINMYGEPEALSAIAGGADTSITIAADGKATMNGEEVQITVDSNGASISQSGMNLPVLSSDGCILIDMSGVLGTPMIMEFSK